MPGWLQAREAPPEDQGIDQGLHRREETRGTATLAIGRDKEVPHDDADAVR